MLIKKKYLEEISIPKLDDDEVVLSEHKPESKPQQSLPDIENEVKTRIEEQINIEKEKLALEIKKLKKEKEEIEKEKIQIKEYEKEAFLILEEKERELIEHIAIVENIKLKVALESEEFLTDLVIKLTEKLIHKKIQEDEKLIHRLMESALDDLKIGVNEAAKISFSVNPLDLDLATKYAEYIKKKSNDLLEIKIIPKETIDKGSCYLEGKSGAIDLNFSSQLDLFKRRMLGGN